MAIYRNAILVNIPIPGRPADRSNLHFASPAGLLCKSDIVRKELADQPDVTEASSSTIYDSSPGDRNRDSVDVPREQHAVPSSHWTLATFGPADRRPLEARVHRVGERLDRPLF